MVNVDWLGYTCAEQVRRGLMALRHRGPDAEHQWRNPSGTVTLGHARLKVIDPVAGDQPHSNESGDIFSVVNGEFYGYEAIRADLQSRGHRFRSDADSEILVHLYEEHGADCLQYLRGEFAFIIWDERKQQLIAARDRFGIKPLFYTERRGQLLLASEVKALHAAGVDAGWDVEGYFEKLVLQLPIGGRTLFRGISELDAGHILVARDGQVSVSKYWDFDFPPETDIRCFDSEDALAEELCALVDDAVRVRMRADAEIACYLSGGIDSSSVLALMSRHATKPVHAFSLTFDDPAFDEGRQAREMAATFGAALHLVAMNSDRLAELLAPAVQHCETFFTNAQCAAKYGLSQAAHEAGFRVAMTGEGADEIFAGYPAFVLDAQTAGKPHNPASAFQQRLGFTPVWHEGKDAFLRVLKPVLPADFDQECIRHRFLDSLDLGGQLVGRSHLNQSLYLFNKTVLPGHVLPMLGDRMEMAHSVEARLPLLDHRLAEFTRELPASMKVRGAAEKFVLRKAMRKVVPPSICGRRKFAMLAPPVLSKASALRDLVFDTLHGSALDNLPFLNRSAVRRLLKEALEGGPSDETSLEQPLMTLLSSCLLGERFKITEATRQ